MRAVATANKLARGSAASGAVGITSDLLVVTPRLRGQASGVEAIAAVVDSAAHPHPAEAEASKAVEMVLAAVAAAFTGAVPSVVVDDTNSAAKYVRKITKKQPAPRGLFFCLRFFVERYCPGISFRC